MLVPVERIELPTFGLQNLGVAAKIAASVDPVAGE